MKTFYRASALVLLVVLLYTDAVRAQTWNTQMVNPGTLKGNRAIVYGDSQEPIVFYSQGVYLLFSRWNGTSWNTRTVDSYTTVSKIFVVRLDSLVHCIANLGTNSFFRHYQVRLDGSVKSMATMSYWSDAGFAVGPSGTLLLANANNTLTLRRFNIATNSWTADELIDGSSSLGQPDVTTGPDGRIWIVYKDAVGQNLKVARSNGSTWDVWFVDTPGNVGDYAQIKVNPASTAHITYYDGTNQQLKYATFAP